MSHTLHLLHALQLRRFALHGAALLALALTLLSPEQLVGAQGHPIFNAHDFPSIEEAVSRLLHSGGTVVVPAGVYIVREKLRLGSNVELRGEGIDRTILVLDEGVRDHLISNANLQEGNSNITIRDLQLRGNRLGQSRWGHGGRLVTGSASGVWSFGVRFVNVTDSLIENVEASDFAKDGFYLGYSNSNGVYRTRIVGCRARYNGRNGISLTHGSHNVIRGCVVEHNNLVEQVGGIQLEPDGDLEISHNVVIENRVAGNHTGITLYTDPPRWLGGPTLIKNAVCYNAAEGNRFVGIWDHYGQGNVFVDNTAAGSEFDFGPTDSSLIGQEYAAACAPGSALAEGQNPR